MHTAKAAEDRLIDAWIALENLYLPEGDTGELSYRLALRAAYFLGGTGAERATIFSELRASYKVRSRLVHGQQVAYDAFQEALDTSVNQLRGTLRRVVFHGATPSAARLDEAVVTGEPGS